ncbi:helix-turn-helix transcriptional regulator [Halobaculum sp. D14]|uniref:helix-turn-helix transcriptional regulator n=1 Tax=unclassified Halobaculum TaxID=2640896 RepID=UPI003EC14ABE
MNGADTETVADVLAKRRDCLDALADGPVEKRDLVDRLDTPRTTLDRAVGELTDVGLAEAANGGYRATTFGREALAVHDDYRSRLGGLTDAAELLDALPADTALCADFLDGADVHLSCPDAPDGVVDVLLDSVSDDARIRGVAPVALTGHVESFGDAAGGGAEPPELVVTPGVLDHLVETLGDGVKQSVRDGEMRLRCGRVPARFGLWLTGDDQAGVVVYTDTGVRGVALNDDEDAVEWARDRFARVRDRSAPVTPAVVDDVAAGDFDFSADRADADVDADAAG